MEAAGACGRANGRAPTSSLDAGKRTPALTATTARASWISPTENRSYTLNYLSRTRPWWPVLPRPRVAGFQVSPEG
jgi:hypothetical protein